MLALVIVGSVEESLSCIISDLFEVVHHQLSEIVTVPLVAVERVFLWKLDFAEDVSDRFGNLLCLLGEEASHVVAVPSVKDLGVLWLLIS